MASSDDVRRLALALPGVVEVPSDGFDFRIANQGFVWSYPERIPGKPRVIRTDVAVLYVGDEAEKQALVLRELVTDAWRMRAPEVMLGNLDGPDDLEGPDGTVVDSP